MFSFLKQKICEFKKERLKKILFGTDPQKMQKFGDSLVVPAFQKAYKQVPAFKSLYSGINIQKIKDLSTYLQCVPIVEKNDIFPKFAIKDLCRKGKYKNMILMMTSSGFSNSFSYGVITKKNSEDLKLNFEIIIEELFKTKKDKAFIINALPMGVKVDLNFKMANTSVRQDMVISFYQKLRKDFDKIIIIGDPHFIKFLIEYAFDKGIEWDSNVQFVSGEDYMSQSLREYLEKRLQKTFCEESVPLVSQTMGMTELDLNLFHESYELIEARRETYKKKELQKRLFGEKYSFVPTLFHYYPHRCFLEIKENKDIGELIVSMNQESIIQPLFRYNTKDIAKIFSYEEYCKILDEFSLFLLHPRIKLPVVAIFGRCNKSVFQDGKEICSEDIKELLYSDFEVAMNITGMFRLEQKDSQVLLHIQKTENSKQDHELLKNTIGQKIREYFGFDLDCIVYQYFDFPYQMALNYEKKFKTI